ncbi:myopalladin-like [Dermacentor albipictus]|uniref:myopalladin-like n=1 Tax=Dermacentor albipictus TaxID=60249 RepID=UPI0038FBFFA6
MAEPVFGPPEVHPFLFSKNVALGAEAVVNCAVIGGDGPFEFRWSLNGERLRTSASKYVEAVSDKIVALTIKKVTPDDVGNYTCTVSNGAGSDSFTAALVVKDRGTEDFRIGTAPRTTPSLAHPASAKRRVPRRPPPQGSVDAKPDIQPFAFSKNAALGHKTSVACFATGGTEPFHFRWTHDGHAVVDAATRHVKGAAANMATLVFDKLVAEHFGNYTCTVSNAHGSSSYTAELVVEDGIAVGP